MSVEVTVEAGDITTFNMQHGFPEAIVRGFRSGLLKDSDYHHLSQCETLEGESIGMLKHLAADYLFMGPMFEPVLSCTMTEWALGWRGRCSCPDLPVLRRYEDEPSGDGL
jgi:hypothetical protein